MFTKNNPEKLNTPEVQQMINCIRCHHHKQIDEKKTRLRDDDLCYIVYEADNIAAAMDRRDLDEGSAGGGFNRYMPLKVWQPKCAYCRPKSSNLPTH